MIWGYLVLAGIEEVIATIAMKYLNGKRKMWPLFIMTIGFVLSFYCLSKAMQVLPAGVAYAVWTGIGTIGITFAGIFWFKEKFTRLQLLSVSLILFGVVGLRLTS